MITAEENELITRVGPGTPMGNLFRRYWIPACLSEEIPEPDCPPARVRLLGEDLVAFRDSEGRGGLLREQCSHRLASLFYGRNEEGGLRCVYHGWKYDVDGRLLDTPCEQPQSMLKHVLRHPSYPVRDINGVIWTYMGPPEKMPLLPDTLWFTAPAAHVEVLKFRNENNYLQGLDGECDNLHTAFLHRRGEGLRPPEDAAPTFDIEHTAWGVRGVTNRRIGDQKVVRTNLFVFPFIGCIPGGFGPPTRAERVAQQKRSIHVIYHTPVDDYNTTRYELLVDLDKPADGQYRARYAKELTPDHRKIANRGNEYLIDRELQRTSIYCGIPFENHTQDAAMTEGMGRIADRTMEHLGSSDENIVAMRQSMLKAIQAFERGEEPPGLAWEPSQNRLFEDLYCIGGPIPLDGSWRQLLEA